MELYLGIDAGGTKTAGVLLDADGRVVRRMQAGACAIIGEPKPEELAVLVALVDRLCDAAARKAVRFCGIGLNGVDFADEIPMQRRAIAEAVGTPVERIELVNDGVAALWGATDCRAAAIVQHGSGMTTAWRSDYGRETMFDNLDVGRMFDIRWHVAAVVARMIDGRLPATPLKDKLLAHFGVGEEAFAETVFRRKYDWRTYVSTAPLIFEAYERRDAAAELLVERTVEDYAQAAAAMVRRTGRDDAEAAFGGGTIACGGPRFWQRLAEALAERAPRARLVRPRLSPEVGAAIMAAFHAGRDPREFYAKLLEGRSQ